MSGPVVTGRVGEGQDSEDFVVYECLLRQNSPFFDNALKGEWTEASRHVVQFPSLDPEIFNTYVVWLYTGRIVLEKAGVRSETSEKVNIQQRLGRLCELGHYLKSPALMDASIDDLMDFLKSQKIGRVGLPWCLYHSTFENSPQRKLAVDYFVREFTRIAQVTRFFRTHTDEPELILDLARRMAEERCSNNPKPATDSDAPWITNPCQYHEHTRLNQPCYRVKQRVFGSYS